MGKKKQTQTVRHELDPQTQVMQKGVYDAARAAAATPGVVDPQTQAALDAYRQYVQTGQQGLAALQGNPDALAGYMNPYVNSVIDAAGAGFDKARDRAELATNDAATQARAFGGSRHGVALGERLGALDAAEAENAAGLRYQGYTDAMGRAAGAANLGFTAAGMLPGLGQYSQMMNDPNLRKMYLYKQGMQGVPYGTQDAQTMEKSRFGSIAGGAMQGASMGAAFGPWGAAIGGLGGGLLGAF